MAERRPGIRTDSEATDQRKDAAVICIRTGKIRIYEANAEPVGSVGSTQRPVIPPVHFQSAEYLQLLVLRKSVKHVLYNTHTGMTNGHYGSAKTLYQVSRRFHWNTWRSNTVRYCRRCPECCEYHLGKLPRQRPLQPVLDHRRNDCT